MAFIIRVNYNREFLFKFLHVNKFFYIHLVNNEKLLYRHNRWFSSSITPDPSVSSSLTRPAKSNEKLPNSISEKFEKLLNTLSVKQGNDFEFPTNFGSVRFDSDINFTSLYNKMSLENENPESNYCGTNNYIEDKYFYNSVSHDVHKIIRDKSSISDNELKDQELNYIDNQYLKVDSISETNTSDIYNSEMKPNISSLNFIDSQIAGISSQTVTESESDTNDNVKYVEEKLSRYYSFEDSLDGALEGKFIKKVIKHDSKIDDENWQETLENTILSMTQDGSKYLRELNQSQIHHKELKLENKYEIIEEQNTSSSFDEEKLKSEPEEFKEGHEDNVKSAWSFVMEKRREEMISSKKEIQGEIFEGERYKKIILAVPSYSLHSTYDLAKELRANILYQNDDFLAISKPYGIPVHGGGSNANDRLNIVNALPYLAELIKVKKLETVHRLDMKVSGVMLLAKTEKMAEDLKRMFKQHKIKKSYCAIVKGVPEQFNGVIDIPIGEGKVGKYERKVLRPDIPNFRGKSGQSKKAITRYKVVSSVPGAALLEVNPITGIKHQIRVHLGFGLSCPVIGDHKYSYLTKIVPQKLPSPILHKLGMEQSKVRTLPMLLHSFVLSLPIIGERGTEIVIAAVPPKYFRIALKSLKLSSMRNRLTDEYSDIIFGDNNDDVKRK